MRKIWFGLAYAAFAAVIAEPAPAQDHHKNFVEYTKELGLQIDPNALRLQMAVCHADGISRAKLRRWYSKIVSPGKRISQVSHPRGRREFHGDCKD
jgi:hypothetical protein